ncbi:MAG TPA: FAD-dependent oxidoreductase [Syntrophorhabdaceae bacterium]|nr:FAD-dependent oxidoreductase [Syntrophorhabdaceae bacterium]
MNVLVIGGGISGISAAKVVLKEGHNAIILENTPELGGTMARIANCRIGFKTFFDEIKDDPRLRVIRDASITSVQKKGGAFTVALSDSTVIEADRVIVASGLSPYDPVEYKGKRVLTSLEYDAKIDQRNGELPDDFNKVGFFLCVGSRSKEYPLCSSVCCSYTIREVKWTLQRAKPEIAVFYNDLRLFGQEFFLEKIYRDAGVRFVRANSRYFEEDEEGVTVRYFVDGELKEERFNYVVLAIGLRPNPSLADLGTLFGFSLNEYGFVKEEDPLFTGAQGVFACGGALEPMNIKDSILTGFGAGVLAVKDADLLTSAAREQGLLYNEPGPEITMPDGDVSSCLFYLGTEDPGAAMFYEYMSARFIEAARRLNEAGKTVYVVTKNAVMPSYDELNYEKARREGVVIINLEEGQALDISGKQARIAGPGRDITFEVDRAVLFDDYMDHFKGKEFLSVYRSEPQLRWSPTKWSRKKYHTGFVRHPRDKRWEPREVLGALGEMILDREEERVYPEVEEERCSGCGSCKDACPQKAIDITIQEQQVAVFGPITTTGVPIAHVNEDSCVACGLCVSTCPSDVIKFPET